MRLFLMDDSIRETIDEAKKIRDEVNDTVRAFIKELQNNDYCGDLYE